ncbi:hypothetical protein BU26DRAFT_247521 [Trematosphaeria pertusa]|uniref:Secreted protein n=1 Tax=Trematosphaeria pertusa TaxID=390896 RepID=A0A6A6INI3_9PLEO|nr:uncharacterized protein BU26DRAFT_247521 [Trematosphaeria pertusa]KAF2251946.1 hypothetical protein BU26DRAFT_247521 [Trematosphaeria pertusa]
MVLLLTIIASCELTSHLTPYALTSSQSNHRLEQLKTSAWKTTTSSHSHSPSPLDHEAQGIALCSTPSHNASAPQPRLI